MARINQRIVAMIIFSKPILTEPHIRVRVPSDKVFGCLGPRVYVPQIEEVGNI